MAPDILDRLGQDFGTSGTRRAAIGTLLEITLLGNSFSTAATSNAKSSGKRRDMHRARRRRGARLQA